MPKKEEKPPAGAKKEEKKEEAPPVEEAPKEAPKPEKTGKREKKRKIGKKTFTLYKIENDRAMHLRPVCERCGSGYFMADHGNRYTCGHCGFTRYKPAEK